MTDSIETLTKEFVRHAAALGEALLFQLAKTNPEVTAELAQAIVRGERMVIGFETDGTHPVVRLMTIDGDQMVRQIMHIGAAAKALKH